MDVSHFELIWKPQSPVGIGGSTAVDTVLQGYFLKITNLGSAQYRFRVEFIATPPLVGQTTRSLAGNTIVFIDTPGVNNSPGVLNGGFISSTFTPSQGLITIPPNATTLVAVLPSAFGPTPFDATPLTTPNFEVRGFVRLTLPALLNFQNGFFTFEPQAAMPVKVLLTPQHRAVYTDAAGTVSDQTQSTLTTASGSAIGMVEPGQGFLVRPFPLTASVIEDLPQVPEELAFPMLAALLAQMDPESDLATVNAMLADSNVPMAVEKRAGRTPRAATEKKKETA